MMAAQQQQPHVCISSGRHHLQQHSSSAYSSRCARGRGRLHVCAAVKQRSGKQLCCSKTLTAKEGHLVGGVRVCVCCVSVCVPIPRAHIRAGNRVSGAGTTAPPSPRSQDQVQAMMKEVGEYSQQRMLDRKAGIVLFQVASDHHLAGTFHTWERYESNADFLKHTASPGVMKFMEGVSVCAGACQCGLRPMRPRWLREVRARGRASTTSRKHNKQRCTRMAVLLPVPPQRSQGWDHVCCSAMVSTPFTLQRLLREAVCLGEEHSGSSGSSGRAPFL